MHYKGENKVELTINEHPKGRSEKKVDKGLYVLANKNIKPEVGHWA